jgi:hypothetical protein
MNFAQNRIVFTTTKSKADTYLLGQPFFRDTAPVWLGIQEEIKGSIVPLHDLQCAGCLRSIFLRSAHSISKQ